MLDRKLKGIVKFRHEGLFFPSNFFPCCFAVSTVFKFVQLSSEFIPASTFLDFPGSKGILHGRPLFSHALPLSD